LEEVLYLLMGCVGDGGRPADGRRGLEWLDCAFVNIDREETTLRSPVVNGLVGALIIVEFFRLDTIIK
jgi:hypothetical protein